MIQIMLFTPSLQIQIYTLYKHGLETYVNLSWGRKKKYKFLEIKRVPRCGNPLASAAQAEMQRTNTRTNPRYSLRGTII